MSTSIVKLSDPKSGDPKGALEPERPTSINTELVRGVRVILKASLGHGAMSVEEMMALKAGSVVTLETSLADHVELFLNDVLVARGEIVAVGDKYGVRIVEIAPTS